MATEERSLCIEADHVSKTFGAGESLQAALKDVSVTIGTGEQWAVVGPSGSGKSTFLYLLGALDRPTAGRLRVNGRELGSLTVRERAEYRFSEVGFVFQDFQLLDPVSVGENVLLPFVGRPRERRIALSRAQQLLESVEMAEAWRKPAAVLSGGEK